MELDADSAFPARFRVLVPIYWVPLEVPVEVPVDGKV